MPAQTSSTLLERFKPTVGRWFGAFGLLFLAFVAWSVGSTGFDTTTIAFLAAIALVMIVDWSALIRPSLVAFEDHLFVRNSWSDLRIPWREITDVDVKQTLHLYAGADRHHSVAIGKSARNMLREGHHKRTMTSSLFGQQGVEDLAQAPTLTGASTTGINYADFVVLKLQTYVSLQRDHPSELTGIEREWAWPQIILTALAGLAFVAAVVTAILT